MWQWLIQPIPKDTILRLTQIFAFANSLLSLFSGRLLERKGFASFKTGVFSVTTALILIWIPIIICLFAAINCESIVPAKVVSWAVRIGVVFSWIPGIILLLFLIHRGLSLDTRRFLKPTRYIAQSKGKINSDHNAIFGIPGIDEIIDEAKKEGGRVRFPMLLVGDKDSQMWHFSQKFVISALKSNKTAIYFSFSRPGDKVVDQLRKFAPDMQLGELHIVDCYGGSYYRKKKRRNKVKQIQAQGVGFGYCDPRNPVEINNHYCRIIKRNIDKKLVVVYESFSDFMYLTDREIAINFLRNNVAWEEQKHIESLYLLRKGMIEAKDENQIAWMLNSGIELYFDKDSRHRKLTVATKMIFPEPRNFIVCDVSSFFSQRDHILS